MPGLRTWQAQLDNVRKHVEVLAEKYHCPQCREALVKTLVELAGQIEARR
jgi:transcription elongation factor Elf1